MADHLGQERPFNGLDYMLHAGDLSLLSDSTWSPQLSGVIPKHLAGSLETVTRKLKLKGKQLPQVAWLQNHMAGIPSRWPACKPESMV